MDPLILHFTQYFLLTILFIYVIILSIYMVKLHIQVEVLKNSTHSVEYVPMDPNWATPEKKLEEINEESERSYPDLDSLDEEEARIDLKNLI